MEKSEGAGSNPSAEIERIRSEYRRRHVEIAADRYSWIHAVNQYNHTTIWRAAIRRLAREGLYPLQDLHALDVGCGRGTWLLEFVQWGADPARLAGIDVLSERVHEARNRLPGSDIQVGDAGRMPWQADSFDVVTQMCVFTSVLDESMRRAIAREMIRVVKPNGIILWYDFAFDNPSNKAVRGLKEGEVRALFSDCHITMERITLAPPIARAVAPFSWTLTHALAKLPFLNTHLMATIRKGAI